MGEGEEGQRRRAARAVELVEALPPPVIPSTLPDLAVRDSVFAGNVLNDRLIATVPWDMDLVGPPSNFEWVALLVQDRRITLPADLVLDGWGEEGVGTPHLDAFTLAPYLVHQDDWSTWRAKAPFRFTIDARRRIRLPRLAMAHLGVRNGERIICAVDQRRSDDVTQLHLLSPRSLDPLVPSPYVERKG